MVFPNTHEAIIDQETWDTAQQMRKRAPRRRPNGSDSHRLSGLVYCADCGARLSYHDCTASRCRDTAYDSDLGFQCSHYGKPAGGDAAPMERTIGSAGGRGKEQRYVRAAIRTIWENASPVLKTG